MELNSLWLNFLDCLNFLVEVNIIESLFLYLIQNIIWCLIWKLFRYRNVDILFPMKVSPIHSNKHKSSFNCETSSKHLAVFISSQDLTEDVINFRNSKKPDFLWLTKPRAVSICRSVSFKDEYCRCWSPGYFWSYLSDDFMTDKIGEEENRCRFNLINKDESEWRFLWFSLDIHLGFRDLKSG